jgi:hypothetical protein
LIFFLIAPLYAARLKILEHLGGAVLARKNPAISQAERCMFSAPLPPGSARGADFPL